MDHGESIRLMAAEKYLLGELTPELREQFEEHFFDCQECALDVRAGAALVEHSKVVLSEPVAVPPLRVPVAAPTRAAWFAWLRPALVVPILAALLVVIGYQKLVTYPQLKKSSEQSADFAVGLDQRQYPRHEYNSISPRWTGIPSTPEHSSRERLHLLHFRLV